MHNFKSSFSFAVLFIFIFVITLFAQDIQFVENGIDSSANHLPCYIIRTAHATYYLEKVGVGLSSLLDKDGNDWIGFHPREGSGAEGEYRGFPNAVHQQDGNFFHPKNRGTDSSQTFIEFVGQERVTIRGRSGNGNWECTWDFYPLYCTFTMTKIPAGYKYWILYEGTPGGRYDDTDWWMTSAISERKYLTERHEQDIPDPEWIVFGDKNLDRVLFLLNHKDDDKPDYFYQMNRHMTVFGFGRKGLEKYLYNVPQSFSIGFIESTNHCEISRFINSIIIK